MAAEGEQRVAGELFDVAAVTADDRRQTRYDRVDYLVQLLRVKALGERREPGDVGEEGCDQPPLRRQMPAGLDELVGDRAGDETPERLGDVRVIPTHGRRRAAMPTKAHPLRVLALARHTDPGSHAYPSSVGRYKSPQERAVFGQG